jgi:hypothetical protein
LLSILLDGTVQYILLFLHHLSHVHDPRYHGRFVHTRIVALTIALVVAHAIAWIMFHFGSIYFAIEITLAIDFILPQYSVCSGENSGNSAKQRL